MNRGQVKRIRNELERLRKGGKEWEALQLLERECAAEEFSSVWYDLWRSQARQALRTAASMELFLLRLREFPVIPDTADIRFLKLFGEYLDGRDVVDALGEMAGLSASAETLRREFLRRGDETMPEDPKLRKLLTVFATAPEKVLQKDYRQLCVLLASCPAIPQGSCEKLEELLTRSRKLNSASAVKNKAEGVAEADLRSIELGLKKMANELPPPFFKVFAAPVLTQVCAAILRIAELNPDQGARLSLAAPFCMESLAGAHWPELRKKFQLESALTLSAADRAGLRKAAQTAGFEERFGLLRKLHRLLSSSEELDEDLLDILVTLYKGIFKELTARRATLSDRDRRRLAAVFGPAFSKDMSAFLGGREDLPFLLDAGASAGCLDARSALLHAFFAAMSRDRSLAANARAMLGLLPQVQERDVRELFCDYQDVLTEDLKALKGMLDLCRECGHELDATVATGVGMAVMASLVMNSLPSGGGKSLMGMFMNSLGDDSRKEFKKLAKGMDHFVGNPHFSFPLVLVKGFTSGRLSGKEYAQLLEPQIADGLPPEPIIENLIITLGLIGNIGKAQSMEIPFGGMFDVEPLIQDLLLCALEVLCGQRGRVARYSTEALTSLVDIMRVYGKGRGLERYMLLIGNVAAERMQTGDEKARKLYANTTDYIAKTKRPEKKRGARR